MLISVVIPFYNEVDFIYRAVESVYLQRSDKYSLEVFIINDGVLSEDSIRSRLQFVEDVPVTVVKNTLHKGPGGARNVGIQLSKGELVAFLDSDDYWLPNKLSNQFTQVSSGVTFTCTGYQFLGSSTVVVPPNNIEYARDMFMKQGVGTSTVLVSRTLLDQCQFRNLRFSQDIDLWYRLACLDSFKFKSSCDIYTIYNPSGSTKNKFVQAKSLLSVLSINKIPLFEQVLIMLKYSLRGVFNHYLRRFFK